MIETPIQRVSCREYLVNDPSGQSIGMGKDFLDMLPPCFGRRMDHSWQSDKIGTQVSCFVRARSLAAIHPGQNYLTDGLSCAMLINRSLNRRALLDRAIALKLPF
jgi:hypothetical protein